MTFDVIVIGAGHAGVEAAYAAAARLPVGLCTLSRDTVAHMPCNPAVGGTAKGHLVREIDALGGVMGRAIDATGIQFKLLNRSRGPAVWSPRAQADKRLYSRWVAAALEREPNITWCSARPGAILVGSRPRRRARDGGRRSVTLPARSSSRRGHSSTASSTSGRAAAGRAARRAAVARARGVDRSFGFEIGRLKTGTPPRLDRGEHRLRRGGASGCLRRGARRRRPGPVLVLDGSAVAQPDPLLAAAHQRPRPRPGAAEHRRSPLYNGRFRGSARATARRSKTRSCGFPTASGTRSTSSRKGWTSTRST